MEITMNTGEDIPVQFFIFVNDMNFMTAHNFHLLKYFSSAAFGSLQIPGILEKYIAGTLKYVQPDATEGMMMSPYHLNAFKAYQVECDAEACREKHHAQYPSRLSALYAFGNLESCIEVNKRYGWPLDSVRRFVLRPSIFNRVVKVNMEIVSAARAVYEATRKSSAEALWQDYWSGRSGPAIPGITPKVSPIWEYLIEGAVDCLDTREVMEFPVDPERIVHL